MKPRNPSQKPMWKARCKMLKFLMVSWRVRDTIMSWYQHHTVSTSSKNVPLPGRYMAIRLSKKMDEPVTVIKGERRRCPPDLKQAASRPIVVAR
jgi:hypothetical protein